MASPSVTSYHSIYTKVERKRLKYVNKIGVLVALGIGISLSLPSSLSKSPSDINKSAGTGAANSGKSSVATSSFWWSCILGTFIYRAPIIFLAIFLVKLARQFDTTVLFSKHKTLVSQTIHSVLSKKFLVVALYYILSSLLIFLCSYIQNPIPVYLVAKEYRQKDFLNDDFVYFAFSSVFLAVLYSVQHLALQRNRLNLFKYGVAKIRPSILESILKPIPRLIVISLISTFAVSFVFCPAFYYLFGAGRFIYRLNWLTLVIVGLDTELHSTGFASKWQIAKQILWCSFHVILSWELINHYYNVYSSIGCLDGKKSISSYSSDPLNTLISGLRDYSNELTRLTAFQELAYISTTTMNDDVIKLRHAIYNANSNKFGPIWSIIFEECSLIIRETCLRVNYRSVSDLNRQQQHTKEQLQNSANAAAVLAARSISNVSASEKTDIFGNSTAAATSQKTNSIGMKRYSENSPSPTTVPAKDKPHKETPKNVLFTYVGIIRSHFNTFYTQLNKLGAKTVLPPIFKSIYTLYHTKYIQFRDEIISTPIGIVFRVSLKRDCESRIIDPITFGNAVISVSHLLIRANEEDRRGAIQNHDIADVLTLLERPIRAMNNYTELLPPSIDLSSLQRKSLELSKQHLIALLHDLSIKEFFDICVKYNSKLNDLILSPRVFKLAKRVIDAAIAQRSSKSYTTTYR